MAPPVRKPTWLIPLVGVLIFGWMSADALWAAWQARSSRRWPTVDGTVQLSQWRHLSGRGCQFALGLHYRYVVDGTAFVGDRYRAGSECGDEVIAIAAAHPVGSRVSVHYDPERPARSVLAAGDLSDNARAGVVVGPALLALSAGLFWFMRRRG